MEAGACYTIKKKPNHLNEAETSLQKLIHHRKGERIMINFINAFLSQIVLLVIIVAVAGAATAIGITWAKKKNEKV